jgi:hypothetical protein
VTRRVVDVGSAAELRQVAIASAWSRADRFTVTVRSPAPSARLGPLPGLRDHDVHLGPDAVTVRLRFTQPVPFQLAVGAILALWAEPARPMPVSPDIAAYGDLPAWLPPAANVAPLVGAVPDLTVIRPYDQLVPGGEPPTVDTVAPASSLDSWAPSVSVLAETEPPPQDYPELEFIALSGDVRSAYGRARGSVLVVTDGAGFEDPSFVRNLLQGNASGPGTVVYTRAELDRELTASSDPAGTGARSGRSS